MKRVSPYAAMRTAGFEPATFASGGRPGQDSAECARVLRARFGGGVKCAGVRPVRRGAQFGTQSGSGR